MSELKEFFDERKQETEQFINFLIKIKDNPDYANEMAILKSQAVLMLYNLIEGTINKGMEYIFNTINDNSLKHDEASQQIRIMWLRYFKLHLDDGGQHQNRLSNFDIFISNNISIDIKEFRKINPSYFKGGSLDSKAIKDILKKFEIEFNTIEYKLQEIKEERNFLAHGEKSFTEIGQTKSVPDMKDTTDKVINFLESYIDEIEKYIIEESYKI